MRRTRPRDEGTHPWRALLIATTFVRADGGIVSAVGVTVDRSGETKPDFGCPFVSLVEMTVENFPADNLPPDLAKLPAVKPGSR